jgi:hypothetical protein
MQLTGYIPCSKLAAEVQLTLDSISALTEESAVKQRTILRCAVLGLAVLALAILPSSASASVIGHLTFANCDGGGVTVTMTTVTWLPPALTGTGCIAAGFATNVTFDSGSIVPAEHGTINDLTPGNGNTGFLAFAGVTFNAPVIGPGVSNLTCSAVLASGPSCSVIAGSPFILTPETSGTLISLGVSGLAIDASSSNSAWSGIFSTQIANETPAQIQAAFNSSGSFTATYSFDGNVGVPEPVSLALIGGGLLALVGLKRRKARS